MDLSTEWSQIRSREIVLRNSWTALIALVLIACGTSKDPTPTSCETSSATEFDKSFTRFSFTKNSSGKQVLNDIKVNDGTDSAYTYTYTYGGDGLISQITLTGVGKLLTGQSKTYVVSYAGSKLSKLSATGKEEIRLEYSGDQLTQSKGYSANGAGTMFQVSHLAFSYDSNGNLVKSETYVDLVALFTVAFGSNPTGYSPILLGSLTSEPSGTANPLYGFFFPDQQEYFVMKNAPQKITVRDLNGKVVLTDTYTIATDSKGLLTKATAGAKYLEAGYACQ